MILFSFTTCLVSFGLLKLVSPVGDSIIAKVNREDRFFTGIIRDTNCAASPGRDASSGCNGRLAIGGSTRYALHDGRTVYLLSDQEGPRNFVNRKVKIRGRLRLNAPVLDVKAIDPA